MTAAQPSRMAIMNPSLRAAPLPWFRGSRSTRAPARSATAAVSSVLPSSTTSTPSPC